VAAVDEDEELDGLRPSHLEEALHGGPDGPAREEDIVDEQDVLLGRLEIDLRLLDHAAHLCGRDVVPVNGDVQDADGHFDALHFLDDPGDPLADVYAAGPDADDDQVLQVAVALNDLGGHPVEAPPDLAGVHDSRLDLLFHIRLLFSL